MRWWAWKTQQQPVILDEFWEQEHPNSPPREVLPQTPLEEATTLVMHTQESPVEEMEVEE